MSFTVIFRFCPQTCLKARFHRELRYSGAESIYSIFRGSNYGIPRQRFSTTVKLNKSSRGTRRKRSLHKDLRHIKISERTDISRLRRDLSLPQDDLGPEQRKVFDLVVEQKKSVFFTGPAGTGKSFLLQRIIKGLRMKFEDFPEELAVTASTGLAAYNIGGVTLHRFAGIGLGKAPIEVLLERILGNPDSPLRHERRGDRRARSRWRKVEVLIIDEISMVDAALFDKLDQIAREVREVDEPFGGIQLVICGDFFQLPPVTPDLEEESPRFCFESEAWGPSLQYKIELTQIYRQKDPEFAKMLNEMREGHVSSNTIATFKQLYRPLPSHGHGRPPPTELFPLRRQADEANAMRLEELEGALHTYTATEGGMIEDEEIRKKLLSDCIAPNVVKLKKGALVLLIWNKDRQLVNGSQGRVIGFSNTTEYHVYDRIWDDEESAAEDGHPKESIFPVVEFWSKEGEPLSPTVCEPETWSVERWVPDSKPDDTNSKKPRRKSWKVEVLATRTQMPLIPAWALSIHKAQGQTLEFVKVDLRHIFETGQAYVALSRVTTLDGLQVLNFNPKKVTADPRVKEFYDNLSKGVL